MSFTFRRMAVPGRPLAVAAALAVLAAAGCGSSSSPTASAPSGGSTTYTIGLLTDASGPGASGNATSVQGVKAGIAWAAAQGVHINLVVGDTETSPTAALSAAQTLVRQDHVLAVDAISALTFAASAFLAAQKIPVFGSAEDGPEWNSSRNMFSITGPDEPTLVPPEFGQLMKMEGGTNLASIGYGISPSSADAAQVDAKSATEAGLKAGYVNTNFPFGSTNVGPAVIAMKNAGIDSFTAATDSNTSLAFITGLKNDGVKLKFSILDTGYGGDLLSAGPGAEQAAQGVDFSLPYEPVEMHTPQTEQFQKYLASAGVKGEPTFAEYLGYASVLYFVQALKAAGATATQASLTSSMANIHSFSAGGLTSAGYPIVNNGTGIPAGTTECLYITQFSGTAFHLVAGADPICGKVLAMRAAGR